MRNKIEILMNGSCRSPVGVSDTEYAQLIAGDTGSMMFEGVTLEDIEQTYLYGLDYAYEHEMMLEAITTTSARVDMTMRAFNKQLNRAFSSADLSSSGASVGKPKNTGGFATLTAMFHLSDGQTISVIFHSPSGDPKKIASDDTLIAFRFLMNRRDITNVVAPSGGADISLKLVTSKLANLLERNSEKFQSKSAEVKAQNDELSKLQADIENASKAVEANLDEKERLAAEISPLQTENRAQMTVLNKLTSRVEMLRKQLAGLEPAIEPEPLIEPESGADNFVSDEVKDLVRRMNLIEFESYAVKNLGLTYDQAFELFDKAKDEIAREDKNKLDPEPAASADNFVSDKIKDLVRDMTLAEFQRYAMANLSMNASDAEQLYKQAGDALKSEYDAKKAQETEALVTTDPLNVFLSSVNDSLKFRVGENELVAQSDINFYPDKKYPNVKVAVLSGKDIVSVRHFAREGQNDVIDIIVDMTDAPEYKRFSDVAIADLAKVSVKNKTVNAVMAMVRKYTSTLVKGRTLPEYGSRADEGMRLVDIAKETRAKITQAKKEGLLPKGLKVSIKLDGYNAINASITDVPEGTALYSDKYLEHLRQVESGEKDKYDYFRGHAQSADITAIQAWVDAQIKAHHWDKSDSMTDYYNSAFHFMGTSPYGDDEVKAKELEAYKVRYEAEQAANKAMAELKAKKVEDEAYMFDVRTDLGESEQIIYDQAIDMGVTIPLHRGSVEVIYPMGTEGYSNGKAKFNVDDVSDLEQMIWDIQDELPSLWANIQKDRLGQVAKYNHDGDLYLNGLESSVVRLQTGDVSESSPVSVSVNLTGLQYQSAEITLMANITDYQVMAYNDISKKFDKDATIVPVSAGINGIVQAITEMYNLTTKPNSAKDTSVWYGLQYRPLDIGAQPKGHSNYLDDDKAALKWPHLAGSAQIRHGAIAYLEPLTPELIKSYQLVDNLDVANEKADPDYFIDLDGREANELKLAIFDMYEEDGYLPQLVLDEAVNLRAFDFEMWIKNAIKKHSKIFADRAKEPSSNRKSWESLRDVIDMFVATPTRMYELFDGLISKPPSLKTPKSTVIKLFDGFRGLDGASLVYAKNNGDSITIADKASSREPTFIVSKGDLFEREFTFEGFNEASNSNESGFPDFVKEVFASVDMAKFIDEDNNISFDGQDALFDAVYASPQVKAYFGDDLVEQLQKVRRDHNSGVIDFMQTYKGAASPAPSSINEPSSKGVAEDTLREALTSATDVETLMDALDAFLAEVEADGSEDEYSELIDSASNRITEMLEAF